MDTEQEEMQFLGLFGIYTEATKVILAGQKIFTKITLTLILPLAFIFLAHIEVSHLLFTIILHNEISLDQTEAGTKRYEKLSDLISSEWTYFLMFKVFYFIFFLVFSLLSTAAVVYTIACAYTGRDFTFQKVMSVVPKVWKRLMVTFLCILIAFFGYNIASFVVLLFWAITLGSTDIGVAVFFILLLVYFVGFVYMTILWHLASVVSVLEEVSGFRAMVKSKALMKGKMSVAIIIFFMLNISISLIQFGFQIFVVHGSSYGMASRVFSGLVCFGSLCTLILFWLVIQTVLYFVCKSYHHENIDKSSLSDHLEVYLLAEYVPLKVKDVQLERV